MKLDDLIINNRTIRADILDACVDATVDMGIVDQTEITLEISDPDFKLLGAGLFQRKMPIRIGDLQCEIAVVETGSDPAPVGLKIQARSTYVQKFKRNKKALVRSNISPTNWLLAEASAVGAKVVGQPSANKPQITRVNTEDEQQSTWDVMTELAGELGYLFFEAAGKFYFGKPTWLVTRGKPLWKLRYGDSVSNNKKNPLILDVPQCRSSENSRESATISMLVDRTYAVRMRPGDPVEFSGVPFFNGRYMVETVGYNLMSPSEPVSISLTTPIDPTPSGQDQPKDPDDPDNPAKPIDTSGLAGGAILVETWERARRNR